MIALIVCGMVALLVWSLFSERLRRWHVSAPVAMVVCGIGTGFFFLEQISTELDTDVAERVVELILAVLLFVDATVVRGGFLGGERGIVARLLALALPVSLALTILVGVPLLGVSSFTVVLVITLVVIPIDFAAAPGFLRDRRIPSRLRHSLAVESGYVDAVRAPIFAFALVVVQHPEKSHSLLELLEHALPDIGFAVLIGVGVGGIAGLLARASVLRGWVRIERLQLGIVLIPLITYAGAIALHGNGFVAAFLAGLSYKMTRLRGEEHHRDDALHKELGAVDNLGEISSLLMWFVFGSVTTLMFFAEVRWSWILFGLLALTLLRMLPIYLAFLGSRLPFREQTALGYLGPRGTSTIVFGLLAFNALSGDDDTAALYVMVVTVLASVVLHSLFGPVLMRRIFRVSRSAPPRPGAARRG